MVAYKDLMYTFILLFTVLSIVMLPAMFFYKSGTGLTKPKSLAQFSLGNLGYSTSQCVSVPYELKEIPLSCPFGTISEIKEFGINPDTEGATKDACMPDAGNKICADSLDRGYLKIAKGLIGDGVSKFGLEFKESEYVAAGKTLDPICTIDSLFFIQYTCLQSDEVIAQKKKYTSVISSLGLLVCGLFSTCVYFLKRDSKLDQIEWDVETITPSDYTMQYEITQTAFDHFLENVFRRGDEAQGLSRGTSLKKYMKHEIETFLNSLLI